ncbi:integrase core domain-containing protein [uncultured Rubinisphaera sp.]|uniref:integrase core domain-containing protein n=1 Tax=uncultured Rubinisphaera sp. TaxID=1678686 RepID=UPI0030D76F19
MKDLFQLLFIHIGTRRIWISPATHNTDANCMSQQAKFFLQHCDDVELKHTIIMRDNDGKFKKGFDEVLEAGKCYVKKNTPKSPNLNAFVERAVQIYEHECLDQFIVISLRQLNVIGRELQAWYNYERPHSSVNYLPPGDQTMPNLPISESTRDVVCATRLGGLLKNYTRRAA